MQVKENMATSTYKNILASMKRYFRGFLGQESLVKSFKFPVLPLNPITIPSKADLQKVHQTLGYPRDQSIFLIFATSGLRHSQVLPLDRFEDVNVTKRMLAHAINYTVNHYLLFKKGE